MPFNTVFADGPFPNTPIAGYPQADGNVFAIVVAPDGSQYVSGTFTEIGGVARNNLARILPNGTVDPSFNPDVSGVTSAMALSNDGSTLYIGGYFSTVNGSTARSNMAAFSTSTGIATAFDPTLDDQTTTLTLSPDGTVLYATGYFTTVNGGTTRNGAAAFSTSTGTATSFNPNLDQGVRVSVLSADGSTLYAGGDFTTVNGSITRNRLAAFSTSTGTVTSFDPDVDNRLTGLALSSNGATLYATGDFTTVNGGTTRNRVAAFNTTNSSATSFNPNLDTAFYFFGALALSSDDATLYVGNDFTTVNGSTPRNRLAAFSTSDGIATSFNPDLDNGVKVIAIDPTTNRLYVGGYFTTVGGTARTYLAAFQGPVPPAPSPTPDSGGSSSASSDTLAPTGQSATLIMVIALVLVLTGAITTQRLFHSRRRQPE